MQDPRNTVFALSVRELPGLMSVEEDGGGYVPDRKWAHLFDPPDVAHPCDAPPFEIDLKAEATPYNAPPYKMHGAKREALEEEVKRLLEKGWIREGHSPWCANPLMVWEPQKEKWRLCIDYRGVNARTIRRHVVMPHMESVWARLKGMASFSVLDLSEYFHQISVAPSSRPLTSFRAMGCQWEWQVVPFGLVNAPVAAQEEMNRVMVEVRRVMEERAINGFADVWMDDVLLAAPDDPTLELVLDVFFAVASAHNLRLKLSKCVFVRPVVQWCGFLLSSQGRKMAMDRMELRDWPVPVSKRGCQKLTGWCNWSAQDHPHLSRLLKPFYEAMEGPFRKGALDEDMECLREELLADSTWLAFPQLGKPFTVWCDASLVGVGASIFQEGKAVAHLSKAFTACQRRWPVRDREMWAVVWALRRCPWLRGSPVEICTDHESLTTDDTPGCGPTASFYSEQRWASWTEFLLQFQIVFTYVPGPSNVGPDGGSRHPLDVSCPCDESCVSCKCARAQLRQCNTWKAIGDTLDKLNNKLLCKGVVSP